MEGKCGSGAGEEEEGNEGAHELEGGERIPPRWLMATERVRGGPTTRAHGGTKGSPWGRRPGKGESKWVVGEV